VLGAAAAGAVLSHRLGRHAVLLGAAGALLPDADVIVPTVAPWAGDPALPWLHHRHFTHALVAAPVIGAIAALPWLAWRRFRARAWTVIGAATIGAATHGLNDALTSFGTHLWWPFTNARTSWDLLPIIDPLVTLPLLVGVVVAILISGSDRAPRGVGRWPVAAALAMFIAYVGFAALQHGRAARAQEALAAERGHEIERRRVTPTMGNTIIWRAIYEHDGAIHADAVRVSPFGAVRVRRGVSHPRLDPGELRIENAVDPERIEWVLAEFDAFADGWIGLVGDRAQPRATTSPGPPYLIGDLRYSLQTEGMAPLWGLRVDPTDVLEPLRWTGIGQRRGADDDDGEARSRSDALRSLWRDVTAPDETWLELAPR